MEIWNHFTFREDMHPLLYHYIKNNNIKYECGEIVCSVDISENDSHWEIVKQIIEVEHNSYISETQFNELERASAKWLTMRSKWYYDYPQPENKYTDITYTRENLCSNKECGIEFDQIDCFRFKRTPKWGKRNFCMTNWIYDELFVSSYAKEILELSDLTGISFVNVKNKNGKEVLQDIYQMKIPGVLNNGICEDSMRIKEIFVCPICGKQKLRSNSRGQYYFKKEIFDHSLDFVKSGEWFGGGSGSSRLILISQKAYQFIIKNKLDSSLVFEPIILV